MAADGAEQIVTLSTNNLHRTLEKVLERAGLGWSVGVTFFRPCGPRVKPSYRRRVQGMQLRPGSGTVAKYPASTT